MQELAPLNEDVPAEQTAQAEFPVPVENCPAGHAAHDVLPGVLADVPGGHSEQETMGPCGVIGLVRNCPTGQLTQEESVWLLYVPGAQ